MPSYVSPGVYVRERDFSSYVAATGTTSTGFVVAAQRGPLNKPVLITSGEAYLRTFGEPTVNEYGPHGVLRYLQFGNQAWVNRVARVYEPNAAAIVDLGTPTDGKITSITVAAGHTLNVGDYIQITQTGKHSTQNLKILTITLDAPDYVIGLDGYILDDYDDSGSSDSVVNVCAGGAGTAPAEVFAFGRRNGSVFPLVKFTARDPGSFANFGTSKGIEIVIEDGGQFQNIDPTSGLPITSDGIPLQGLNPSMPSVDTKIDLLNLIAAGTARVGETRGVNFDSLVGVAATADAADSGDLRITIPLSTGWVAGDDVVISGTSGYDGTYEILAVSNNSTQTLLTLNGFGGTVPGLRASTVLTSNNTNVTANDTVTVASKTYTFVASPTTEGHVKIGTGADDSLLNLSKAINRNGVHGTDYVVAAAHPTVMAGTTVSPSHTLTLQARAGGTAANAYATTDTATTLTFTGSTMAGGTAVAALPTGSYVESASTASHRFGTVYRCATGSGGLYWVPEGVLTKRVKVLFKGNVEEIWDNVIGYDPTSANFWNTVVGTTTQPVSAYVTAEYLGLGGEQPVNSYNRVKHPNNPRYVMGLPTQIRIADSSSAAMVSEENAKGYDGDSPTAADYIGVVDGDGGHTGLKCFYQVESYDINLLAVPGVSLPAVIQEMIALCEVRHDCLALVDPPMGLSVQEVVDWHNGSGSYSGLHSAFVTNKAALYYPWVKMYDPYNSRELMLPPSCILPGVFAYSDQQGESWFAPAGITRGKVTGALGTERILGQGDTDYMYGPGNGNAVNAIMTFSKDGVVVYGQRTLQRHPSALDRVNVRRLLFYIEKNVARAVRVLAFEQNDPILWENFRNLVEPFLQNLVGRRALEDFIVVCDATTNTPERRNNNELYAKLIVIPVKSAEKIILDLTVLASGINVSEFATADTGTTF